MYPLRPEHVAKLERTVRIIEAQRHRLVDIGGLRGAALRDRTADVDDHGDDALGDKTRAVAAHRDRHPVGGEQAMRGIAIDMIGHRRAHDGAAFDHGKQRVDGHCALRIEFLFDGTGGCVFSDRRHQDERICTRLGARLD